MRFSLIDRITALAAGESISAVKNLSAAEEYLADHFPGFAVMPGVLMLESLVQTGAWLMRHTEDFRYSTITLKQARALKFNHFVEPGQTLATTMSVHKRSDSEYTFKAEGVILTNEPQTDGETPTTAVTAKLTLEQCNLGDRNPKMQSCDEQTIEAMRTQFGQLWRAGE